MRIYDFQKEEKDSSKMKNTITEINSIIADRQKEERFVNEIEYVLKNYQE